jgi:large subunit ribosomal protein L14
MIDQTMLSCIDNSGAAIVECALVVGQKKHATIGSSLLPIFHPACATTAAVLTLNPLGDRIVAIVQKQRGASDAGMGAASAANKVKRGDIRHAIIVRTKKKVQRPDGSVVRFDDNACVLINKAGDPIGTRVNGVVGAELRRRKWSKILSMAPMHA